MLFIIGRHDLGEYWKRKLMEECAPEKRNLQKDRSDRATAEQVVDIFFMMNKYNSFRDYLVKSSVSLIAAIVEAPHATKFLCF